MWNGLVRLNRFRNCRTPSPLFALAVSCAVAGNMKIVKSRKENMVSACFIGIILLQRYRFSCGLQVIGCEFWLRLVVF